jgi:acid stress chaperone HdeB
MKKRLVLALAAYFATGLVYAQVTVDVSKITCKQFLAFSIADPRDISIWLSGYYHGKQSNTMLHTQELKENYDKVKNLCYSNYDTPVMQVIEKLLLKGKS